ncbi:MAG: hypothetical protein M3N37_00390, partial [Actinomycetota bacterium]|nr:hypothetical protein [Actinomycetota bacterium]
GRNGEMHRMRRSVAALSPVVLAACGGGAGGATGEFCDQAAERVGAFRDADGEVSPTLVGTLRELAVTAPDELADDFEAVTEGSGGAELDRAVDNIEGFLVERCGLEVRR